MQLHAGDTRRHGLAIEFRGRLEYLGFVVSAITDVANDPRRIPGDDRVRWHRSRHHRPGPDHCTPANPDSPQQCRIGADRRSRLDDCLFKGFRVLPTAREAIVGEGGIGTDENVIAQTDAIPELYAAFHRDAIAHDHVVFDEHAIADIAIATDLRSGEDVGKGPDPGIGSYPAGLADGFFVD